MTGCVQLTVDGNVFEVESEATIFIPPGVRHSVRNDSDVPARLIAVHASAEPKVLYPDGMPEPVKW